MKYEVKLGDTYRWLEASTPFQAAILTLRELSENGYKFSPAPFFVTNIWSGDSEEIEFSIIVNLLDLSNNFVYDENEEPELDMESDIVQAGVNYEG